MKNNQRLDFNLLTTCIVVVLPIVIIVLSSLYIMRYSLGILEISLLITSYYACNISVGLGFHRLWSHGAYKTNKVVEFILMLLTAGTLQGPVIAWASDHRKHHAYTDAELDPHTPSKYQNKIMGFLWSQWGWMMFGESSYKHIDIATWKTLGKNKILVFQLQYYWQLAILMNVILPATIGYLITQSLQGVLAALIFMGLGRAIQQQFTFAVNSVCHLVGTRKYSNDTSRDIWWLFMFLLGENWHNFHHAFSRDYRNGHKWYHLDIHKWLIALMEKCGLAHSLVITSNVRIQMKEKEIYKLHNYSTWSDKLATAEKTAHKIAKLAREQILTAEKSATKLADNIYKKLIIIERVSMNIADKTSSLKAKSEILTENLVNKILKRLKYLEKNFDRIIPATNNNSN